MKELYDVVVVGGGPAGMSAALMLGRCRRSVVVCDAGNPRNIRSHGMHGFLTRDGLHPGELARLGREELARYGVEWRETTVMNVVRAEHGFDVKLLDESALRCRKIVLATGVVDKLPQIPGFDLFYGTSIHHCPYCDGWEHNDEPIAVYGNGRGAAGLALKMLQWSADVVICSDGAARIAEADKERISKFNIRLYEGKIARLEGECGKLERIVFADGAALRRKAMFFSTGNVQRSRLPEQMGCEISRKGAVHTEKTGKTCVAGVYVVGDASHDAQFVIVAAAEGTKAGMAVKQELLDEDLGR